MLSHSLPSTLLFSSYSVTDIIQILNGDRDVAASISEHHSATVFPADPKTRVISERKMHYKTFVSNGVFWFVSLCSYALHNLPMFGCNVKKKPARMYLFWNLA